MAKTYLASSDTSENRPVDWFTGRKMGQPTGGSASEPRATEKWLTGVESKNKAIIARFDIGRRSPLE